MSIFKSQQRDPRTLRAWLGGLFGQRCRSTVSFPNSIDTLHCRLRRGHKHAHIDKGMRWGYGDNWLEGN